MFCAFVVGLIVLPPGARLQLAAVGNGDVVLGATVVLCAAYVLLWADHLLEHPPPRPGRRAMVALLVLALVLWLVRPLWHGIAMLFIQYPLVTWLPFVLGVLVAVVGGRRPLRRPATCVALALGPRCCRHSNAARCAPTSPTRACRRSRATPSRGCCPNWPPRSMGRGRTCTARTSSWIPTTDGLAWSAEERRRLLPFGASEGIGVQPLDRVDGTLERRPGGFKTAVSAFGPGTMLWRAAKRHFAIRVQDPVIVPLDDGRAIAIAPYTGYRGFLVRRPYWRGVFVYHQDGRLEDLSPAQAQARPELARSGRLFPEHLARDIAEAHGARVADAPGNPQPYLTNIGDGRTRWITVAHRDGDNDVLGRHLPDRRRDGPHDRLASAPWPPAALEHRRGARGGRQHGRRRVLAALGHRAAPGLHRRPPLLPREHRPPPSRDHLDRCAPAGADGRGRSGFARVKIPDRLLALSARSRNEA